MRCAIAATSLALVMMAAGAHAQPKEYDLDFKHVPKVGWQVKVSDSDQMKLKLKMVKDKKVMLSEAESESQSFVYTRTILAMDGETVTKESLAFEKATHVVEGEKVSYGFEGKTVVVTTKAGAGSTFAYEDGSQLGADDLAGMQKVKSGREDGDRGGDEVLNPGKPVKVGESWKPDVKELAMGMLHVSGESAVDLKKSTAKLTLKKVTEKDGALYASVKGTFKLFIYEMGEMVLEKPVLTTITITGEFCVDGSRPDGVMELGMKMKGLSPMDLGGGQTATVQLDMNASMKKTVTTVQADAAPPEQTGAK